MTDRNENSILFRRFAIIALAIATCGLWAADYVAHRNASGWETKVHKPLPLENPIAVSPECILETCETIGMNTTIIA